MDHNEHLDGPDFLEQIADIECGDNRLVNGAEFRRRAKQWAQDRRELQEARDQIHRMKAHAATALTHLARLGP